MNTRTGLVNQTSALDIDGGSIYAGFCGVCDIITSGNNDPASFQNGIATNVQSGCEPKAGTAECWSIVPAKGLPNRYITDIEIDGKTRGRVRDGRRLRPSLVPPERRRARRRRGPRVREQGRRPDVHRPVGHRPQRLPTSRRHRAAARRPPHRRQRRRRLHRLDGRPVLVALGTGLPNVSTFDLNLDPSGSKMVAATHGRGVWVYDFRAKAVTPPVSTPPKNVAGPGTAGGRLPATGAAPLAVLGVVLLGAAWLTRRRTA
jgi:hypothetical protein